MISRRKFMSGSVAVPGGACIAAFWPNKQHSGLAAQNPVDPSATLPSMTKRPFATPEDWAAKLIQAAQDQIGQTIRYDGAYVRLNYPNGDVPREVGVCTDVVIRAYRDAFDLDLQQVVHEDMKRNFSAYPKTWGLKRPDRNIDHRRVPNLENFLRRQNSAVPITDIGTDYLPGDLVSQRLPGNLPHIAIVTHHPNADGKRPLVVHNIGAGAQLEDRLFDFKIVGHFRYRPIGI